MSLRCGLNVAIAEAGFVEDTVNPFMSCGSLTGKWTEKFSIATSVRGGAHFSDKSRPISRQSAE